MNLYKVRETREEDIDKIIRMMSDFPESYPEPYLISNKRGGMIWQLNYLLSAEDDYDGKSYVLEIKGEIAGHIAYWKDERCFEGGVYELRALIVSEKHQGQGYGEMLIEYLDKELISINARLIWLQVNLKSRWDFYEKYGYSPLFTFPNYWGTGKHRLIMAKNIKI